MGRIKAIKTNELVGVKLDTEYVYPITSTKAVYSPAEKSQETINNEFFEAITKLTERIVELEKKNA